MAWPTDDLTTDYIDSSTDDPALGIVEIYEAVVKLKAVLEARGVASGVASLDGSAKVPLSQMHAALSSIAGLTTAANKMIYTSASDTYATANLTAFARTLLDDADADAVLATLGIPVSVDYVAIDGDFEEGSTVQVARVGKLVAITSTITEIPHVSTNRASSDAGVIPIALRPEINVSSVIYCDGSGMSRVQVNASGNLYVEHRNWSGSLMVRTGATGLAITYSIY